MSKVVAWVQRIWFKGPRLDLSGKFEVMSRTIEVKMGFGAYWPQWCVQIPNKGGNNIIASVGLVCVVLRYWSVK